MQLERFVNEIKACYGGNLESLILYGSAATEDFSGKYSDYNLMIVLKILAPAEIRKGAKAIRKWTKGGNPPPLFFDGAGIRMSADVFPIEFHDIKASRKILFGSDPFADIAIDSKNLRHQCESELKGKTLALLSKFMGAERCEKEIARLMLDSFSAFLAIFKGVIRLLGREPEPRKRAAVEQLSALIGFSPNIFMELLDIREGLAILPRRDVLEKFEDYLAQIAAVTKFVDGVEV